MQPHALHGRSIFQAVRQERCIFAAKLRASRALLGWSQTRFASEAGITQRAVHKLEQGDTEPRRVTELAIAEVWRRHQIFFEDATDGTFQVSMPVSQLERHDSERVRVARSRRPRALTPPQ